MISELYGKISRTGRNLSDRMEDKLTGDFFGTLRYLPFELGVKPVLSRVRFLNNSSKEWSFLIQQTRGYSYDLDFWIRGAQV